MTNEASPEGREQEMKVEDAGRLAALYYYTSDYAAKRSDEKEARAVREVRELMGIYIDFRVRQDPEMGNAVVTAFESFRDPNPELATLEAAQDMQEEANDVRHRLGLPRLDIPDTIPAADINWSPDRPH
jgi:hypothetical protein